MLEIKLFTSFLFVIFSFLLLFFAQTRTAIIAGLILIHLGLILFLSCLILNQDIFKEMILIVILYLIVAVFAMTHQKEIVKNLKKIKEKRPAFWVLFLAFFVAVFVFISSLILVKISLNKSEFLHQQAMSGEALVAEKNVNHDLLENHKKLRIAKKMHENYLLKHSSDLILLIVFLSGVALFFVPNFFTNKNDL